MKKPMGKDSKGMSMAGRPAVTAKKPVKGQAAAKPKPGPKSHAGVGKSKKGE